MIEKGMIIIKLNKSTPNRFDQKKDIQYRFRASINRFFIKEMRKS